MWEACKQLSLGRYRRRHLLLLATATVMAVFALLLAPSPKALAADATRSGNSVSYDSKIFTELNLGGATPDRLPTGLPASTSGYQFIDTAANKTYFILTTGDASKATQGEYVFYDGLPSSNFSNPSPPKTISIADDAAGPSTAAAAMSGAATKCDTKLTSGIGWFLCPTVNFLASGMDNLFEILSSFMTVHPINMDPNSSIHRMWAVIRDIANICFVIGFILIVYSQVTSLGISNYGIKRLLPRLIVAAILVNTSYLISAAGVDISNFLGHSIHEMLMNIFTQFNTGSQYKDVHWSSITTYVLSGGTIATLAGFGIYGVLAGSLAGSLMLLITALVSVLTAVIVAILVLAARQALIICLVIISPLAFVAYLLPNTEKYFDKWKDLFMTMLILFPAFSLVFAGAQVAGLAIIENAGGSLNLVILGMAVMVAPVVVTPLLVKLSGSFLGKIAGLINNPKKGVIDRTRNWAQARQQERKASILAGKGRNTWANRATRAIDRKRRNREGLRKADEATAGALFAGTSRGMAIERQNRTNANLTKRAGIAVDRSIEGQRIAIESRNLDAAKMEADTNTWRTRSGQAATSYLKSMEDAKRINESDLTHTYVTSTVGRANEMHIHQQEKREEDRKGEAARHISELTAGEATDGYYGNFASDGHLQVRGATIAANLSDTHMKVTLDNMAKRNAEFTIQSNIADEIEKNDAHAILNGQRVRTYAAGIAGAQGEASALAGAITTSREQFAKFSAEYEQVRDKYMPPFSDIQKFLSDKSEHLTFKDASGNSVISIDHNNAYAVNAMVKHVASVGVVNDVDKLIEQTGKGEVLHEYRETVADVLAQKGYGSRSIYEGGQVIELVRQGQIASRPDLLEHVQGQIAKGKVAPSDLSTLDASAIGRFIEAIDHSRRVGQVNKAGVTVESLPNYLDKVAQFVNSAHSALTDPRLKGNVKDNARVELQKLDAAWQVLPHTTDAEGNEMIDVSKVTLDDIKRLLGATTPPTTPPSSPLPSSP